MTALARTPTLADEWRRALPRPLVTPARFELARDKLRVAIPLPRDIFPGRANSAGVDLAEEAAFVGLGQPHMLIRRRVRRKFGDCLD